MKKIIIAISAFAFSAINAQFSVSIKSDAAFSPKEAYLYTTSGSKDILVSKIDKNNQSWFYKYPKSYVGMMKIYFPESNTSFGFASENKDIEIDFKSVNNKISDIDYKDATNALMDEVQNKQRKVEIILPALYQMKSFYKPSSDFAKAIDKEIGLLSDDIKIDASKNPFVAYYKTNYKRFLANEAKAFSADEVLNFLSSTDEKLETSTLLRPILSVYLQNSGKGNASESVDKLLDKVNIESPRGQIILSELIELFDMYGMDDLKAKYLSKASNLKCSITDRLASTIKVNKDTELGAKFSNYTFVESHNTKAKSIYDVKAKNKVIVFWSSTCSHCEAELPQFIAVYNKMKEQGIEIIGLSLDTDKNSYLNRIKDFPWINATEFKAWHSSFTELYNVHATPTYFILDENNKILAKPNHIGDVFSYFKLK